MNYYATLLLACLCMNASHTYSMEHTIIDMSESDDEMTYTDLLDQVGKDITQRYKGGWWQRLTFAVTEYNASTIANIPEQEHAVTELINNFFMWDMYHKNNVFQQAIDFFVNKHKKLTEKHITGNNIDHYEQRILQQLCDLQPIVKKYVVSNIKRAFLQTRKIVKYKNKIQINCTDISKEKKIAAIASIDCIAKIWKLHNAEILHTLQHPQPVNCISFSTDGSRLITITDTKKDTQNYFYEWDTQTGTLVSKQQTKHNCAYYNHRDDSLVTFYWGKRQCNFKYAEPDETISVAVWHCKNGKWNCASTFKSNAPQILNLVVRRHAGYSIENKGLSVNIYKNDHLPTWCNLAFENSKNDSFALHKLEKSTTFQQLDDYFRRPLQTKITRQISYFTIYKKQLEEQHHHSDSNELSNI